MWYHQTGTISLMNMLIDIFLVVFVNLLLTISICLTPYNPVRFPARSKPIKLEDVLGLLAAGFLRGGFGFLKSSSAGEMIKGSAAVNREIRVGVTHVSTLWRGLLDENEIV